MAVIPQPSTRCFSPVDVKVNSKGKLYCCVDPAAREIPALCVSEREGEKDKQKKKESEKQVSKRQQVCPRAGYEDSKPTFSVCHHREAGWLGLLVSKVGVG